MQELVEKWAKHKITIKWLSLFFNDPDPYFDEVGLLTYFHDLVQQEVNANVRIALLVSGTAN